METQELIHFEDLIIFRSEDIYQVRVHCERELHFIRNSALSGKKHSVENAKQILGLPVKEDENVQDGTIELRYMNGDKQVIKIFY